MSVPGQFSRRTQVGDGNLFSDRLSSGAPNVRMEQYQLGGQTCKDIAPPRPSCTTHRNCTPLCHSFPQAARGRMLVWDKERPPDLGPEARKRSRYVTPPQGRFVPPLKSWCAEIALHRGFPCRPPIWLPFAPLRCARAMSSTDPYGIGDRPCIGVIQDTAFRRTVDGPAAAWSTYSLSRGARVSHG